MTKKQELFIKEYLLDLNGTAAAIRAGYSPKTAKEQASRMLANVNIRARVDKELAERSRRTGINADRVIRELARIALVNPVDVVNMDEATIKDMASSDDTAAILSVKVKRIPTEAGDIMEREIRMADKIKALELLGKHLGMFTDRLNINAEMAVKIVDDIDDED
ncbi:MAG: terminase small subunit [Peptococcaceae bacterium]|nr:terminase small subunit [Candidatus Syntrophopropionicum ammoniitolerans]